MRSNGAILPATLVIISLLLLITTMILRHLHAAHGWATIAIHANRAKHEAEHDLVRQLSSQPTIGMRCQRTQRLRGKNAIGREICSVGTATPRSLLAAGIIDGAVLPDRATFPLFDYQQIFQGAQWCPATISHYPTSSRSGLTLSSGSARSFYSCATVQTLNQLTVRGNVDLISPLNVPRSAGGYATIAATGYIALKEIIVRGDTLIIAGGDLLIQKLSHHTQTTLISATGKIKVQEIAGAGIVKAIAWNEVSLPTSTTIGDTKLIPALNRGRILSLGSR